MHKLLGVDVGADGALRAGILVTHTTTEIGSFGNSVHDRSSIAGVILKLILPVSTDAGPNTRLTKSSSNSLKARLCSSMTEWPASAIEKKSALTKASAISCTLAGGKIRSLAPATTRTGQVAWRRNGIMGFSAVSRSDNIFNR